MLSSLCDAIRNAPGVVQLRRVRHRRYFFRSAGGYWGLHGEYPSMQAARQEAEQHADATYDDERVVDVLRKTFTRLHLFDYPVLWWLKRWIEEEELRALVDFGGHVGVKYYACQTHLRLPGDFQWQVVDVPAMTARGTAMAARQDARHLTFFNDIGDAPESRVLFCSGSLMYVEERIDSLLRRAARTPDHILINKLAVLRDREVVGLEGFGVNIIPYRVFSYEDFGASLRAEGYRLVDEWDIQDRRHGIPFVTGDREIRSIGQVWTRVQDVPDLVPDSRVSPWENG